MSTLLYNPIQKPRQQFLDEFVVRTEAFEAIFKDLQNGRMDHPEQHYLIVGQRGAGKTTLLTRLKYAIEDDPNLNPWLLPLQFDEEQYHISELANLWEHIAELLQDYHGFEGLADAVEALVQRKDFESAAFETLRYALDQKGKKLVLFIDNIGDLLKKFDDLDIKRLREILQTVPHLRIIAGSAVVWESLLDYHQPLFEFFKVIQLKGLSSEETFALLRKLALVEGKKDEIERIIQETPGRIEALRTLCGGVPRTIALLFRVLIDDEHGNALLDLEKVLDLVTPLYKHRMDDLPPQQQKIVDAVARNWNPVSVKKLSSQTRLESKLVSAQLRQLVQNQVVDIQETGKKNHLYLLNERFYNIWYLMRYGRKGDRQRVLWLVKFLELWCDKNEIEQRIIKYVNKYKGGMQEGELYTLYAEVYSFFESVDSEIKFSLLRVIPDHLKSFVEINDVEILNLMKTLHCKRDWSSLADLIAVGGVKEKRKEMLSDFFYSLENDDVLEFTEKVVLESTKKYGHRTLGINWMLLCILRGLYSIFGKDDEESIRFANTYASSIPLIWSKVRDIDNNELESYYIMCCLMILAAGGYLNIVRNIVEAELEDMGFNERYPGFLYSIYYFNKEDKSKLIELSPENKEQALIIIQQIKDIKERMDNHKYTANL